VITLWVGLAAALGAVLRYVVDRLIESAHDTVFPFGTLTINLSGSFLLGLLTGLELHHGWNPEAVTVLGVGLLGGYTTFSTWSWESVQLAGNRAAIEALGNVFGSLGLGLAAAGAGLALGRL